MDQTVTQAATWTPFLLAAARARAPWRLTLLPVPALAGLAHKAGLIERATVKQLAQRAFIGRTLGEPARARLAERFAARVKLRPGALAQLASDRAEGWQLVLATASMRFYAEAIATRLGFDAVIATESVRAAGGVTFRIAGENCYGEAKLRRIEAWLAREGLSRSAVRVRVYSDHASDAPALAWADEAVAVNPNAPLRRLARAKGWPILDWR